MLLDRALYAAPRMVDLLILRVAAIIPLEPNETIDKIRKRAEWDRAHGW